MPEDCRAAGAAKAVWVRKSFRPWLSALVFGVFVAAGGCSRGSLVGSCIGLDDFTNECGGEFDAVCEGGGGSSTASTSAGGAGGAGGSVSCKPGAVEPCYTGKEGTEGLGICKGGTRTCNEEGTGFGACLGEQTPKEEDCDTSLDEDCDGQPNQDCDCVPDTQRACYGGDPATQDEGECHGGMQTCKSTGLGYGPCVGEQLPQTEDCSTDKDEACTGTPCANAAWSGQFGNLSAQTVMGVGADSEGNVYVTGMFSGSLRFEPLPELPALSTGDKQIYLVKFNAAGKPQWSQRFGNVGAINEVSGIAVGAEGIAIGGNYCGNTDLQFGTQFLPARPCGQPEAYAVKFDFSGSAVWATQFNAQPDDYSIVTSVAISADGRVLLAGRFRGRLGGAISVGGSTDLFLLKVNDVGVQSWRKPFGDDAEQQGDPVCAFAPNGEAVMASSMWNGAVVLDGISHTGHLFVVRYQAGGGFIAKKVVTMTGSAPNLKLAGVAVSPQGEVVIAGDFVGSIDLGNGVHTASGLGRNILVAKLDASLARDAVWSRRYGDDDDNDKNQYAHGLAVDPSGNVIVAGAFGGVVDFGGGPVTAVNPADPFVVKLEPDSSYRWSKHFTAQTLHERVATDGDGNVAFACEALDSMDLGLGYGMFQGSTDIVVGEFYP